MGNETDLYFCERNTFCCQRVNIYDNVIKTFTIATEVSERSSLHGKSDNVDSGSANLRNLITSKFAKP